MAKRPEVIPQLKEIAARDGVTVPWERITINRWKPDTCGCILEHWFDDAAEPRVLSYARTVSSCPAHATPNEAQWNTVKNENGRKNGALAIVEGLIDKTTREDRTTWSFSDDRIAGTDERVLELVVNGASNPQRSGVQSAADTQFGANAIRVS